MRGQSAEKTRDNLKFTNRKAAKFLYELVKSGIAAAKENHIEADQLIIKEVYCNEAPRMKRAIAWSKGQSRRITKRTSHITLTLESVNESKKPEVKKNIDIKKEDKSEARNPKSETNSKK